MFIFALILNAELLSLQSSRDNEITSCSYLENSSLLSLLPDLITRRVRLASFRVVRRKSSGDSSSQRLIFEQTNP